MHLIVAGVAGDQAHDLERRFGEAELAGEQLDVGGERLRPGRGFGGAAQIGDDRLTLVAVLPVEVGKGEAAGIELVEDLDELRRDGEAHILAALTQETEEGVEAAQGQLAALENPREVAGDEAALNVRGRCRLGLGLVAEKPHVPYALPFGGAYLALWGA